MHKVMHRVEYVSQLPKINLVGTTVLRKGVGGGGNKCFCWFGCLRKFVSHNRV